MNLPMDVTTISNVIRQRILPHGDDEDGEPEVVDMKALAGDSSSSESQNANILDGIIKIWTALQTTEETPTPIVYRFIDSKSASGSSDFPIFSYAVLLVLTACASNHSVCVVIEPMELCFNAFTIRALLREVVEGCSVLSAFQFISIIREIANKLHPLDS